MRYKLLGHSGLRVSELGLGAMTFGEDWGWGAEKAECERLVDAFADAGGNYIDTANRYTEGTSEKLVGEMVRGRRARFVVSTKYTLTERPDDANAGGNHRKNLVQSLEGSLKRLGTDYIDLYWVHLWDPMTPIEETLRALDDAVRAGKMLYVGISDAPAWLVAQANTIAAFRGWTPFVALQVPYSLIERTPERELLPMAKALDIAVTTWGPLGAGVLTGKYTKDSPPPAGDRLSLPLQGETFLTDRNLEIAAAVRKVASELGATPSQVALAWVLAQRERALVVPLLGARKLSQLEDNLKALELRLPPALLAELDAASRIELGFPSDFLAFARDFAFGETIARTDDHRA